MTMPVVLGAHVQQHQVAVCDLAPVGRISAAIVQRGGPGARPGDRRVGRVSAAALEVRVVQEDGLLWRVARTDVRP